MAVDRVLGQDDAALLDELAAPPATSDVDQQASVGPAGADGDGDRPEPSSSRLGRRGRHLQARQVERVVRHVRVWSVLRVAVVFYTCLWLVLTVAGVIVWRVAVAAGAIDNVESFLADALTEKSFHIDGGTILGASALAGVVLVVAGTLWTVVLALLFNLISDLTGGIRVSVVELETAHEVADRPAAPADPGSPAAERVR